MERKVRVFVADSCEPIGELVILDKLVVEGEELPYAYAATLEFSEELKKRLNELGLTDWCIIGSTTLELLKLIPDIIRERSANRLYSSSRVSCNFHVNFF